jgi:SAM-dependent methyltransferase
MHTEAITPRLDISPDALVLEVGSGHRPHPRADILTDKYLDDVQRGGRLVTDRQFVRADAQQLPFKPGAFDYVLCRHVLEHTEEPDNFFREVSRVGSAGYIETPSVIWEHLHPTRTYHRWFVLEIDGELVLMRKPLTHTRSIFGPIFEMLNTHSPEYRLFIRRYAGLFYVRHQWRGEVQYRVDPPDAEQRAWFWEPWDADKVAQFVTPRNSVRQAIDLLSGAFGSVVGGLRRRLDQPRYTSRRRPVNLAELMQCPICAHETIEVGDGHATCPACGWHTVVVLPE